MYLFINVCVCVCVMYVVCMHVCIYVCMYPCVYVMHLSMCVYACMYELYWWLLMLCKYVILVMYVCGHYITPNAYTYICSIRYLHKYTVACMHRMGQTHTHIAHMHTYIHTHTYIHDSDTQVHDITKHTIILHYIT